MMIDVCFPVLGEELPSDSFYALFGALSSVAPAFHAGDVPMRFALVGCVGIGQKLVKVTPSSRLRVRLPADRIALALPLSGSALRVGEHPVMLGVPTVHALEPATTLYARLVTYKNAVEPARFLEVVRDRLLANDIRGEPAIPVVEGGPHAGLPVRRVLKIKGRSVVGYPLLVEGLSAEGSIRLQEKPMCGRSRLGCGFFLPFRRR